MSRIGRVGLALAFSVVWTLAAGQAGAQSQCASQKLNAAGGYFASFAKCLSKGTAKGLSPDPLCVAKAQTKLFSAFGKAERKADCVTLGDFLPVQDVLDDALPDLLEVTDPPPPVCCEVSGGEVCVATADAAVCTTLSGVQGAPGTVCSGNGSCVPPGAVVTGACCDAVIPIPIEGSCFSGPSAALSCQDEGAVLSQGRCHHSLGCVPSAQDVRSRCTAAKLKSVGSYFKAVTKCEAKAAKKGAASAELLCLGKAQSKLLRAFQKAEKKKDCLAVGDLSDAQGAADDGLQIVIEILRAPPSVCCTEVSACFWAPDEAACTGAGGTPGAAGTVCSGDGSCSPPPAAEGNCCQGVDNPPLTGLCGGGSSQVACTNSGGSFVGDAVCLPAQLCID